MVDLSKQRLELTPEEVEAGTVREVTLIRLDDLQAKSNAGRNYTYYSLTVSALVEGQKLKYNFLLYESQMMPLFTYGTKNKLTDGDEVGLRLTLGTKTGKNKDGTPRKDITIVKVEGPAQNQL